MDRYEADWNIVRKGWEAHVLGEAPHRFTDALTAVKTLRVRGRRAGGASWRGIGREGWCVAMGWRGSAWKRWWGVEKASPLLHAQPSDMRALPARPTPPRPTPAPALQADGSAKPVSDQWLDPFVVVGEDGAPVGTVQDGEPSFLLSSSRVC